MKNDYITLSSNVGLVDSSYVITIKGSEELVDRIVKKFGKKLQSEVSAFHSEINPTKAKRTCGCFKK